MLRILFILAFFFSSFSALADHAMGGEITWKCVGNSYQFELVFYRDCNGAEVNTLAENLAVWNHPTVSTIQVLFVSRQDISPSCSPVAGSPSPLACGSGASGGNGTGAVEKVIYRSVPTALPGTPPAGGWIFTYDNFSRNGNISNLQNANSYGITISATMFAVPNAAPGVCTDNSPHFLQDPYFISCAGDNYEFNLHPVDIDLDSLHMTFGTPLNDFSGTFNPPTNPTIVPFEVGYSVTSPTPNTSFNAGNIPAVLDAQTGNLTFLSNTIGSFVIKIQAESFRNGTLIARVEREIQIYVVSCAGANTAPDFVLPASITVTAGSVVNFPVTATDVENLQDGSPQSNYLSATGFEFGTGFTSTSGCLYGPCATLTQTPIITGVQGASTTFNWQTDCAHLVDPSGNQLESKDYTFVFKVQDNYCQIPKATYQTVVITVEGPGIIPATNITCVSTAANGDVTITWDPVTDPDGTFAGYELNTVQGGTIGGPFPIGTTSFTLASPGTDLDFFVSVLSGCNGTAVRNSDTLKNVYLTLFNPANGTAQLDWNTPISPALSVFNTTCSVLREYPTGTWTTIATLPYETTNFVDTIDICDAFLNYQVIYSTATCGFNSNIVGDDFEDMQTPDIPVISAVSIDTTSGQAVITWTPNGQPDTYGYVIYWEDPNGFIVEIDTVYGINNTTYTYTGPVTGPLTFSLAAFDSCQTAGTNPTYQTSAKAELNTSMFTGYTLNRCNSTAVISWTPYVGWDDQLTDYTVFAQQDGGTWFSLGSTSSTSLSTALVPLSNYCIVVQANNQNGTTSLSNKVCFTVDAPSPPVTHYLRVATVSGQDVVLRHQISTGTNVTAVKFQKFNALNGIFEDLVTIPATSNTLSYTDTAVDVHYSSYLYNAIVLDSCGMEGSVSNVARTVLLQITTDQIGLTNYLSWSDYIDFDGGVLEYQVYRGIDGFFDPTPFATLNPTHRFVEDNVAQYSSQTGKICYFVVAVESPNQYGIQELSVSNEECAIIDPLVYIPNAFTPEGLNPIFIPVVSFHDISKYEFSILDRWGQLLFQTHDINEGWDGTHQGNDKLASNDVYVYVVKVVDGNNQEYFFRGTVTVVK